MATTRQKHKIHHKTILLEVLILVASVPIWRGIWRILDAIIGTDLSGDVVSIIIGIISVWLLMNYAHHLKLD
jgi:hypothetical protein